MAKKPSATSAFVHTVKTVHQAEIAWWWTDDKLHDLDYHIKVSDSVDAKVKELESKYDVSDDARYCCQWEGKLLYGENREQVEAAASELGRHLSRFKGLAPFP